jgi:outer membrane lipoprotein-sorting protein
MVNRNDADREALLQQVIEHLRRQEVPEFPDPELAVLKGGTGPISSARPISTLRRIAMNRRFQASVGAMVGLAATLGFVLLWGGGTAQQASAMEKMAESIRKAKSYTFNVTVHDKAGSFPLRSDVRGAAYWAAPGSVRMEMTYPEWKGSGPEMVTIYPFEKPGIHIFHPQKTFDRLPMRQKQFLGVGDDDIGRLANFSGKADRQLGTRKIDGQDARGFAIDNRKIQAGGPPGTWEIWVDAKSNLPVLIRSEVELSPTRTAIQEMYDIRWNIDLDRKLFDTTPPKGYTDATRKPAPLEEQLAKIREALRIYAEVNDGHYPAKSNAQYAIDDVFQKLGIGKGPQTKETAQNRAKYYKVMQGMSQVSELSVYNPGFAYYGKTVGPKDKDKTLLRWKLDDGRYEVIFGDLHVETVTAERLRALEAK